MKFIPDDPIDGLQIPYYEEASSSLGIVGHTTNRTEQELRIEIERYMAHLGAAITGFASGRFGEDDEGPFRHGYVIDFKWEGNPGRIIVAGLPIRKETVIRIDKAKRHALYSVMLRLQSQFNSQLVMPGDMPLVPYLLNESGQTLMEVVAEQQGFPQLEAPQGEVVEGDFRESE